MMIGANYLNVFFASTIAGRIGGLYEEQVSASTFWLIHAAVVAGGGVALLVLSRPLRKLLSAGIDTRNR
jgi:amino acid transporter